MVITLKKWTSKYCSTPLKTNYWQLCKNNQKNNSIAITPKRPVPQIEEENWSEQLQSIFPDVDETVTKESETFKEKIEDLDRIIEKLSNIDDDQDEQKLFEFEFFTGNFNQKIRLFGTLDFQVEI